MVMVVILIKTLGSVRFTWTDTDTLAVQTISANQEFSALSAVPNTSLLTYQSVQQTLRQGPDLPMFIKC